MSKGLGSILLMTIGKINSFGKFKVCERCPYWSLECNGKTKHCESRSHAEGVVWHLGNYLK